ncbi:sugar ABC transporter substrate-binding protein [Halalkalibacter flavus]|uniref:sugar ABC transporter substrate-binding protein n=1 Tax=Halalkalibacter flavus TaxID=3090668 RepID=UPI002FC5B83D
MKKRSIFLLITFIFTAIVVSFISFKEEKEKTNVVVVVKELNSQYFQIIKAGVEKGFEDLGLGGSVIAPINGTVEEQVEMLENVLKEKPDILIVSPISPDPIIPVLDRFADQNIPVLLLDTDDPWENKTAYIGTDNYDLGRKAGMLLASELQPGDKVAMIGGDNPVISGRRMNGAKISLEAVGIHIASEKTSISELSNDPIQIKEAIEEILQDHPDLAGVIAVNDISAIHVLETLKEDGLNIPVIGADGIVDMLELIEKGTLQGTVVQNPYDMGYLSVLTALKVTNGDTFEMHVDSGVDLIVKENARRRLEFLKKLLSDLGPLFRQSDLHHQVITS